MSDRSAWITEGMGRGLGPTIANEVNRQKPHREGHADQARRQAKERLRRIAYSELKNTRDNMHFALIDDKHTEAIPELKGAVCPGCGAPVIAKCGTRKVHHWAHRDTKMCDSWWETETEWHRRWKNNFPVECQEVFLPDERTGEKHIADVRTEHGLVIEFQHSHITPEERISREQFYKDMIWVVDGTRLQRDLPRFEKGSKDRTELKQGMYRVHFADECFPRSWLESSVPVVFDFLGLDTIDGTDDIRNPLYCLFPSPDERWAEVASFTREAFIRTALNGKLIERARSFMDKREAEWREEQRKKELEQKTAYSLRPVSKSRRHRRL